MLQHLKQFSTMLQHQHLSRSLFRCPGELHSPGVGLSWRLHFTLDTSIAWATTNEFSAALSSAIVSLLRALYPRAVCRNAKPTWPASPPYPEQNLARHCLYLPTPSPKPGRKLATGALPCRNNNKTHEEDLRAHKASPFLSAGHRGRRKRPSGARPARPLFILLSGRRWG